MTTEQQSSSELDDKDGKILEVLQEHAEYTTRQIAKKTLLPATTIHNRIRKLRQTGMFRVGNARMKNGTKEK